MNRVRRLLSQAQKLYDSHPTLAVARSDLSWERGGNWMAKTLSLIRSDLVIPPNVNFALAGTVKYAAAGCAGVVIGYALFLLTRSSTASVVGALLTFYAIEAQMVFLFPLLIDGEQHPLRASRSLVKLAGGTLAVMNTVIPIAAVMIFGGFFGQGFLHSWCSGCGVVVLWYEELRTTPCGA